MEIYPGNNYLYKKVTINRIIPTLPMSLSKYYKYAVTIPSVLVVVGYLVYSILYVSLGLGRNYKSEWLDANAKTMIPCIVN